MVIHLSQREFCSYQLISYVYINLFNIFKSIPRILCLVSETIKLLKSTLNSNGALSCPAGTDCQGYVGLVANGRFDEALRLIKERIPLPGCIGRVCPHPCEDHCRRGLVEEPISIAWIKRFAADWDQSGEDPYLPPIAPDTGKSVAIIGGGP